ncbi:MAG: hypothetical protein JF571_01460 [Asticcacaulis sp.]|nr:hypothetical protein [Asticcacaulis sp.]
MEHDKHWAFICHHVMEGSRPVKCVVHDTDGDWQVLCGEVDNDIDKATLLCSACAVEKFPEIRQHEDLQPGFAADLDGEEWVISSVETE